MFLNSTKFDSTHVITIIMSFSKCNLTNFIQSIVYVPVLYEIYQHLVCWYTSTPITIHKWGVVQVKCMCLHLPQTKNETMYVEYVQLVRKSLSCPFSVLFSVKRDTNRWLNNFTLKCKYSHCNNVMFFGWIYINYFCISNFLTCKEMSLLT